jgi:hypothetical protein
VSIFVTTAIGESHENRDSAGASMRLRMELCMLTLLVVTILALYSRMLGYNELVLDDVVQAEYVQGLTHWWQCFQLDSLGWFRPFKNLVFYLTRGEEGSIYATQIACLGLLLANVFAVYTLLRYLYGPTYFVLLGTALFALNPTMVSSVQFLSACNNQLSLFFLVMYLHFGLRYMRQGLEGGSEGHRYQFFLCLAFLSLALIGYEAAVSSVGILCVLMMGLWSHDRFAIARVRLCLAGSFVVTFSYLFIRSMAAASNLYTSPSLPSDYQHLDLILRAPYYTWQHFLYWVSPWGSGGVLMCDDPSGHLLSGIVAWCLLLLLVGVLLWALLTRFRLMAAGLLIFMGAFVPLSNYLGFGNGPLANYYLLLPGLGLVLLVTDLMRYLLTRASPWGRGFMLLAVFVYLCGYGLETHMRVEAWSSGVKLRELSLRNEPDNYINLRNAAIDLLLQDEDQRARVLVERAIESAPWEPSSASLLAQYYQSRGRLEEALSLLQDYNSRSDPVPWPTLAREAEVLIDLGRYEEAYVLIPELLRPSLTDEATCRVYLNIAVPCLFATRRLDEASHILNTLVLPPELESKWQKRKTKLLGFLDTVKLSESN